jgi:isoquinoline 1-oxidoreductase alpha subunit
MALKLTINNAITDLGEVDPDTPLLWALRDHLGLVGTKYGCGIAQCGACTVWLDGEPARACQLPVGQLEGRTVTTIEGLAGDTLHPVQQSWIEEDVAQCGYCQAGQIMSAAALLARNPNPSDADIDAAMAGNICRCGTYVRIRKAIRSAAQTLQTGVAVHDPADSSPSDDLGVQEEVLS